MGEIRLIQDVSISLTGHIVDIAKWEHVSLEQGTLFIPHTKNGKSSILHLNHMAT